MQKQISAQHSCKPHFWGQKPITFPCGHAENSHIMQAKCVWWCQNGRAIWEYSALHKGEDMRQQSKRQAVEGGGWKKNHLSKCSENKDSWWRGICIHPCIHAAQTKQWCYQCPWWDEVMGTRCWQCEDCCYRWAIGASCIRQILSQQEHKSLPHLR